MHIQTLEHLRPLYPRTHHFIVLIFCFLIDPVPNALLFKPLALKVSKIIPLYGTLTLRLTLDEIHVVSPKIILVRIDPSITSLKI